ncbi:hypothetical protein LDO31_08655 [Luteimonas sp. XNQY3]|nr:hypothetical protein [Luteimonas sp. XNQY3]MCD9006303.1 hypothetical protein [Luteimonas sp. XNQY3]
MADAHNEPIVVTFTSEERHKLAQLSELSGQSLADYIRERVLAESRAEEEVIRFLLNELVAAAMSAERAGIAQSAQEGARESVASLDRQRDRRIAKEVRASLSDEQIDALAQFLSPAFEQGLWSGTTQPTKKDAR